MLRAKCMKARSIRAGSNPAGSRGATQGDLVEAGDEKRNVAVREASSELDGEGRAWEKVAFNEHSKALAAILAEKKHLQTNMITKNCHMESTFGAFVAFGFKKAKTPFFHSQIKISIAPWHGSSTAVKLISICACVVLTEAMNS